MPLTQRALHEYQWAALARLYAAGPTGIESRDLIHGPEGLTWRRLARLRNHKPKPFIEMEDCGGMIARYYIRITPFGIGYYKRKWRLYREEYPNVEAEEPR